MSDQEQTAQPFEPISDRGQECQDLIASLRSLGVSEDEIKGAALTYWTGQEPSLFQTR